MPGGMLALAVTGTVGDSPMEVTRLLAPLHAYGTDPDLDRARGRGVRRRPLAPGPCRPLARCWCPARRS